MIVSLPKCEWCGTIDNVFRCKVCDRYSCSDCLMYTVSYGDVSSCEHKKYEPAKGKGW
jgi:hypothetical protein